MSPAKSEFSDDVEFSQDSSAEVVQAQLDWLLAKLIAAEARSTDAAVELNILASLSNGSNAANSSHQSHVDAPTEAEIIPYHGDAPEASQQELHLQLQDMQSELAAAQQQAKQAEALQQQVREPEGRLAELAGQADVIQSLQEQLADTQEQVTPAAQQAQEDSVHQDQSHDGQAHSSGELHRVATDAGLLQDQISQLQYKLASTQEDVNQVDSLREQLLSVQAELEASQATAAEAAASKEQLSELHAKLVIVQEQAQHPQLLQAQLADLQRSLTAAEEVAADEPLKQQLNQLQAELQSSHEHTASLQQQLEAIQAQADSSQPHDTHLSPALSQTVSSKADFGGESSSGQSMEQPSASMTTAEADLVEAASNAIQAQVGLTLPSDRLMNVSSHIVVDIYCCTFCSKSTRSKNSHVCHVCLPMVPMPCR